jgi:thioredoxin 1
MKQLFFAALCMIAISCQSQNIVNLTVTEFEKISKDTMNQLVDVRTSKEFVSGHIGMAKNMDVNEDEFETQIQGLDKSKPVYVYCLSGGRSKTAAKILLKQGFKEVYNLDGGVLAWRQEAKNLVIDRPTIVKGMSPEAYQKLVTNTKPVLVEFYAEWCGPCKVLKPEVEKIKAEHPELEVVFVDVDQHKEVADGLKIKSIPALYYYVDGKKKWTIVGAPTKKQLYKKLKIKM